jgi:mono/diheme cytochrome c family protein
MWFAILLLACGPGPSADDLPPPVQEAMAQALPDDLSAGRLAFRSHCAGCHGSDAGGDGPAAAALSGSEAGLAIRGRDPARLRSTIERGVTGTAMQGFVDLDDVDLDAMVAWLVSLPAVNATADE